MGIPLRLLDHDPYSTGDPPEIGDCWYLPAAKEPWVIRLSNEFERDWRGKRQPIMVQCPGVGRHGWPFCVDQVENGHVSDGAGWTVTGVAPNITLVPSVNAIGAWHGFITGGVIDP